MLEKNITYTDYNGETVTEKFCFSLNKAELIEMELTTQDGVREQMTRLLAEDDKAEILKIFKKVLLDSIGRRSEDGRLFIKNDKIREEFEASPAFGDMLVEFYSNENAMADFLVAIVPSDLAEAVAKGVETVELPDGTKDTVATEKAKTWDQYTRQELVEMSSEDFNKLYDSVKGPKPAPLMSVAMQRKQS